MGVLTRSRVYYGLHNFYPLAIVELATYPGHIHESRVRACVSVWGQKRELMLPPSPPSASVLLNMTKQLWDSCLRVDDEAEQSSDFKHRKWEFFPTTTKVMRTVNEYLCVCVCVCVCVFRIK